MRIVNCIVCGVEFLCNSRRYTCSAGCHDEQLKEVGRRNYQKNREQRLAAAKLHYFANRETKLEYQRSYCRANPERIKERAKKYKPDPKKRRESQRRYREDNHEKVLEGKLRDYAKGAAAVEVLKRLIGPRINTNDRVLAKQILKQLENTHDNAAS